nr:ribonuclease H-like domain-containing protein [Tanacetum cinerariifolium]
MTDYSLWKVINNGNKVLKRTVGTVEQIYEPTSAEEKLDRKNKIKARGTLLMELPNKDQLKFHLYKDAKLLVEAIEKRYGGNKESKKDHQAQAKIHKMWLLYPPIVEAAQMKQITLLLELLLLILKMAMLTIRARRFIKRTGRNLDINGQKIGFDRSKVECFNFHKNRHFARECRAPKNQENRKREYGRKTMPVENPTKNALIAQDVIRVYDWSYQAEEEHPTNYTLMALTSSRSSSSSDSEVDSCSRTCIKAYGTLKEQYDSLSSDYKKSQFNLVSYKAGLQSIEERLAHYKKNEDVFEEKINILNLKVKLRDNALVENTKKLKKAEKERDGSKLTLEKFQKSSKSINNLLENQVSDKVKTGLGYKTASLTVESFVNSSEMLENQENVKSRLDKGYHAVPLPYTRNYIPPKPDLMFIDEQVESESVDVVSNVASSDVKTVESKHKSVDVKNKGVYSTVETKHVRKNSFSPPIIKDWNSNDESEVEFKPKVKGNPQQKEYKEKGVIDSGCSRHITRNKCYLTDYEDYDGRFVSFGDGKGRISGKCKIKTGTLDFDDVYSWIKREFSVARTPRQNGVTEKKNKTLIEAVRTMLVDPKLPTTFWAEAVNTACYVLNRTLVIKPHNKTPYELIRGRPLLIDFIKPFGCPVTILNTRDSLGKFDGNVDEGFFVGFLETTPNVKVNGPDWLFDIDSLTISMNYEPIVAGKQTNGIAGTKDNIVAGPKDSAVDAAKKTTEVDESRVSDNGGQDDQVTRRTKKDERGIVVKNKARLVAQGHTQEEGIDYDEKFDFTTIKTASTPIEPNKALVKDAEAEDVDVHLYRSIIGSLMYLTASMPDITFAVCACARFLVTPKTLHIHVVKRIFRYSKESIATASCCGQVLWIQNQMLDYGFSLMNTKIYIDNESTICIVKNLVFYSKPKHIEIRHHFIIDSYEKKLIQAIKIHTDHNVVDLLTKAFDVGRFNFLVASIGLLNL